MSIVFMEDEMNQEHSLNDTSFMNHETERTTESNSSAIQTRFIHIDSRQRDPLRDPNSNSYRIYLDTTYDNVLSMELTYASVPKSDYNVDEYNNIIDIAEYATNGTTVMSTYSVIIPPANYSIAYFASQLQKSLIAGSLASGSAYTFTVTVNPIVGGTFVGSDSKLNISATGNFALLFASGKNADVIKSTGTTYGQQNWMQKGRSARIVMGFPIVDVTNWSSGTPLTLTTLTSTNKVNLFGEMYTLMKVKTSTQNEEVTVIESIDSTNDGVFFKIHFDNQMDTIKVCELEHHMVKRFRRPIKVKYLDVSFVTYYGNLYNFRGMDNNFIIKLVSL